MNVFDDDLRTRHCGETYKTANLNHIGQAGVAASAERRYSIDFQKVATNTRNLCAHIVEHRAKLANVRFAGSVENSGFAFGKHRSHYDVGRTRYRSLFQKDVSAFEVFAVDGVRR